MLEETGLVVALEADSVWVETIRKSTCGSCAAQAGCGHSILNRISAGRRNYIEVFSGALNASSCAVDDHVRISIPEGVILKGSLVVYMLPLLTLLLGASLGASITTFGTQDITSIVGAVCGFIVGAALVRLHAWYHRSDTSLQPRLLERVQRCADIIAAS